MYKNLTAAIITGGKSKRFGRRKALALWKGKALISYSIDLAQKLSERILLVFGDDNFFKTELSNDSSILADLSNVDFVQDTVPDCGPVAGIYSALLECKTDWLITLPCDMPLLSLEIFELLLNKGLKEGSTKALIARSNRGLEPLIALWHKSSAVEFKRLIDQGHLSLQDLALEIDSIEVNLEEELANYKDEFFSNINYEKDLEALNS